MCKDLILKKKKKIFFFFSCARPVHMHTCKCLYWLGASRLSEARFDLQGVRDSFARPFTGCGSAGHTARHKKFASAASVIRRRR